MMAAASPPAGESLLPAPPNESGWRESLYDSDESLDELDDANLPMPSRNDEYMQLNPVNSAPGLSPSSSPAPSSDSRDSDLLDEMIEIDSRNFAELTGRKITTIPSAGVKGCRKSLKLGELLEGCRTEAESVEAKRVFKLRKATKELLETEKDYVQDLSHITEIFELLKYEHVDEQEASVIFKNVEWLFEVHTTLMAALTHVAPKILLPWNRVDLNETILKITRLYTETDFLSVYAPYCASHPAQLATLRNLATDPGMGATLSAWQRELPVSLPLEAYLLKPIQRVLKYRLLFSEILKASIPEDSCYVQLEQACSMFQDVATSTNQIKRQRELKSLQLGEVKVVRGLSLGEKLHAGGWDGDLHEWGTLLDEAKSVTMVVKRQGPKRQSRDKLRTLYLFERGIFSCKTYSDSKLCPKEIFPLRETEARVHNSKVLNVRSSGDTFVFKGLAAQDWADRIYTMKQQQNAGAPGGDYDSVKDGRGKLSKKRFQLLRNKRRSIVVAPGHGNPRITSPVSVAPRLESTESSGATLVSLHSQGPKLLHVLSPGPSYVEQLRIVETERDYLRVENDRLVALQDELKNEVATLQQAGEDFMNQPMSPELISVGTSMDFKDASISKLSDVACQTGNFDWTFNIPPSRTGEFAHDSKQDGSPSCDTNSSKDSDPSIGNQLVDESSAVCTSSGDVSNFKALLAPVKADESNAHACGTLAVHEPSKQSDWLGLLRIYPQSNKDGDFNVPESVPWVFLATAIGFCAGMVMSSRS